MAMRNIQLTDSDLCAIRLGLISEIGKALEEEFDDMYWFAVYGGSSDDELREMAAAAGESASQTRDYVQRCEKLLDLLRPAVALKGYLETLGNGKGN